jgi:RNA polymerase sigma-70 factor (sigma-E family)
MSVGERVAFGEYVRARSGALLRAAQALTANRADAEDLLQATLVKAYQSWDKISDPAAMDTYVRRVMVNTHISGWRRRRLDEYPTDEIPDSPAADATGDSDLHDVVQRAVDRLPRQMRAAVMLRFYDDMTEPEVAAALGVSVGTVKSTVARAVAKLRKDAELGADAELAEAVLISVEGEQAADLTRLPRERGTAPSQETGAARLSGASGVQVGTGNVQHNYVNYDPSRAGSGARPTRGSGALGPPSRGHAFMSYVREDSAEVDALQKALEEAGIPVWRDTSSLWPGENWKAKIRTAINADALVFIACFSTNSAARQRSYQNEELMLAIDQLRQRRPDDPWLIPVRLDDCDVPDFELGAGRTLGAINRADLFGPNRDQATRRVVEAVRRLLR